MSTTTMTETTTQTSTSPALSRTTTPPASYDPTRVVVLPQGNSLRSAMTVLRDVETGCRQFTDMVERVSDMLISAGMSMSCLL